MSSDPQESEALGSDAEPPEVKAEVVEEPASDATSEDVSEKREDSHESLNAGKELAGSTSKPNQEEPNTQDDEKKAGKPKEAPDDDGVPEYSDEPRPLECNYQDHSFANGQPVMAGAGKTRHGREPTFPMKLHMILSKEEFNEMICWLPHGRSWRVLNQDEFEKKIIPLFFKHGRYASFHRQVNGWGFRRITSGNDFNSYYHEVSRF